MNIQPIPNQKCILVCINDKKGEKPSCGDHQGPEIFRLLRESAKSKGLHPRFRVTQVKCLGQCQSGCTIMTYPDGQWFSGVRLSDVPRLEELLFT